MKIGTYKNLKKVNFQDWESKKFQITLFDPDLCNYAGCGWNLLSTLVGEDNPYIIREKHGKDKDSCPDSVLLKYLKLKGYKILELTQCLLSNNKKEVGQIIEKINRRHILVVSQLIRKNECSWFIIGGFSGLRIHNQSIDKATIYDFINFPIHTAYIVKKLDGKGF